MLADNFITALVEAFERLKLLMESFVSRIVDVSDELVRKEEIIRSPKEYVLSLMKKQRNQLPKNKAYKVNRKNQKNLPYHRPARESQ